MARKKAGGLTLPEPVAVEKVPELEDNKTPAKAPRPGACRRYARSRVAKELPAVMDTFLAESKAGSLPHWNALVKLAGLDEGEVDPPKKQTQDKSLEELLLTDWKRQAGVDL